MEFKKYYTSGLLGLVLASGIFTGCSRKQEEPKYVDPNAPIVEIKSLEGYKEARVVGKDYTPALKIKQTVEVSTDFFSDSNHSHEIPIDITQSEKYFLFVEIDNRTFVKEVDPYLFREAPNNGLVMVRYTEKRELTFKPGAELEKIADNFDSLIIQDIELKK
ncbi:MAG: hypothetical protein WC867_07985 [Candidatus Pacearchaeota archaeon]|jgi:hypothetical protein